MNPNQPPMPRIGWGLLRDMGEGRTQYDLFDALARVAAACMATGKKGTVTLKIGLKPERTESGAIRLEFSGAVTSTEPRPSRLTTLYYVKDDGKLSHHDPRQPSIPGLLKMQPDLNDAPPAGAAEGDDDA